MKKSFVLLNAVISVFSIYAQEDSTQNFEEVVVYANKFAEKKKNLAQKIDVVTANAIAKFNTQNTGDLLVNTGSVFVQKSQQGGSSPVLRGFEASRILLVIDGIRMNNLIYRAGHLQNIISVDQNMLEQMEILYGPSSTIYGSDALGGVIHLRTKSPKLSVIDKTFITGNAFARFSSANKEKSVHANLSIGGKKFAWLQSYTFSDFDDLKMGSNYTKAYPNFGRRNQYIQPSAGNDRIVTNADDRVQIFSGYKQWDIAQKILYQQSEKISHQLNLQYSNSTDVPRYDRLQDLRNGNLRFAQWYYGPQKRLLGAYELNITNLKFADALRFNVNYQDIEESRHTREYQRYDRLDSRMEKVNVAGFTLDGKKNWKKHELTMGVDGQFNNLKSSALRKNILTNISSSLDSRYPNGKNKMNTVALFAQHLFKFGSGKWILNEGLRFQKTNIHSVIDDNSFFNFPFTQIKQNNFAFTGNFGLVNMPADDLRLSWNFSTGFRSPNVDDLSRIFESASSAKQLVIPNPGIKPEYTFNLDAGITKIIQQKIRFEVNLFYTWLRNAIVLSPFKLNGQDSVIYNGVLSGVMANQNKRIAFIYGFSSRLKIDFSKHLSFDNTFSFTYGRFLENKIKKPLDHIPPTLLKSSISFSKQKLSTEIYLMYNSWKRLKDYNITGEDNLQYATPDGMPEWFTLNWRGSYRINKIMMLQIGVENLFDRNYRTFGSGFSSAGRNFIISARATF